MAGRYARVVRDLAAAAAQLRPRAVRDERAAAAGPAAAPEGAAVRAPGPWLRLTAVGAVAGVAVVVATGEWALLARGERPPDARAPRGVGVAARAGHPDARRSSRRVAARARALPACRSRSAGSSALGHVAWSGMLHIGARLRLARGGVPLRRARVPAGRVGAGRIVARLRDPHEAADHVAPPPHRRRRARPRGRRAVPSLGLTVATLGGLALACGGASALNHVTSTATSTG